MTLHIKTSEDGDWIALYKDDVKLGEGHSMDIREGLRLLGVTFAEEEVPYEVCLYGDGFPEQL